MRGRCSIAIVSTAVTVSRAIWRKFVMKTFPRLSAVILASIALIACVAQSRAQFIGQVPAATPVAVPTAVPAAVPVAVSPAEPIVIDATNVIAQSATMPGGGIPRSLIADAHAVAIIPNMVRGAFVVGVQHGRGVLLLRDAQRNWQPPRMIQINGGSIGYQIGVQATDLILVFRTSQSVQNLLSRTIKIGADASAAAGPVGRSASAATDLQLKAEILSYSRSRGAFVGVSIDGSSIALDPATEVGYYQQPGTIPASAAQLIQAITAYSAPEPAAAPPGVNAPIVGAPPAAPNELEAARQQLDAASRQLAAILDDNWKRHLALPPDIYIPNQLPNPQTLQQAAARYEDIARRQEYVALYSRPEFQETRRSLSRLQELLQVRTSPLQLPPPPVR
jgi:SH3 domain-containing YSC84-like protein 1